MGFFSRSSDNQDLSDEQAVARYRYMLRTAPPDEIEKAHEEAFARLTPEQRRIALQELAANAPQNERSIATDDPKSLARLATRSEIRQPGILERIFGSTRAYGSGMGLTGGMFAGSLLSALAGSFIGSAIAQNFFADHPFDESTASSFDPEDREGYSESNLQEDAADGEFTDESSFDGFDGGELV